MHWPVTKTVGQPGIPPSHPILRKKFVLVANYDIIDLIYKALAKMQTTELVIDQDFFSHCGF